MNEQRFEPGRPIDQSEMLVVEGLHSEWLEYYPEIAQVAEGEPTWSGKTFAVFPVSVLPRKALDMVAAETRPEPRSQVKNVPYPLRDEKGKLQAVVVYQTGGYTAYDALYTYRLDAK